MFYARFFVAAAICPLFSDPAQVVLTLSGSAFSDKPPEIRNGCPPGLCAVCHLVTLRLHGIFFACLR
jgi:hypothetical protein